MYVALFLSVSAYFFSSALGTACDWTACLEIYCPSTGPNAVPNQGQCLCTAGIWETAENNITTCLVEACPSVVDSGAQQDLLSGCCSGWDAASPGEDNAQGVFVYPQVPLSILTECVTSPLSTPGQNIATATSSAGKSASTGAGSLTSTGAAEEATSTGASAETGTTVSTATTATTTATATTEAGTTQAASASTKSDAAGWVIVSTWKIAVGCIFFTVFLMQVM